MTMNDMIMRFPAQLQEAVALGKKLDIAPLDPSITNIVIAGMGGSGIGANFVATFIRQECPLPIHIVKGYTIPAFVGKNSLCIVSSYSGNTEETLDCMQQMEAAGATIIALASGGEIAQTAQQKGFVWIKLPGGWTSPRACLGFSMTLQLFALNKLGLVSDDRLREMESAIKMLEAEQTSIREKGARLADLIYDRIPVIYSEDRLEPVAVRFRQQLNENSKMLCWHHIIPEMNHNELVGWRTEDPRMAALFLRTRQDHPRNVVRTDIVKEVIGNYAGSVIDLYAKGNSLIEQALYLVHLVDWTSLYAADRRQKDPVEIHVIDYLKKSLAEL